MDIWTPGTVSCIVGVRGGIIRPLIYAPYLCEYVHEHTPLATPGFCSDRRIPCKPSSGALLSTSTHNNKIVKVLIMRTAS